MHEPMWCATALARRMAVCGPLTDAEAGERARVALFGHAGREGWLEPLAETWPALAPVFAASPYLAGLAVASPERLRQVLADPPEQTLADLIATTAAAREFPLAVGPALRAAKARLHLLVALADLGGVWNLMEVTAALSDFADAAVRTALAAAVAAEASRGRLRPIPEEDHGSLPGLFVIALGKHGARELNYSSDIDVSVFYEPTALAVEAGVEPERVALRLTQAFARTLSERTADGYVFRVDLRLRPDPASTPVAVPVEAALAYYESVGQNWERAALIKARPVAGDLVRADAFLAALNPFVWRRALDYAAVADVHAILRQIQVREAGGADLTPRAPGANLKLGAGGIREIEFFVQTQQLVLGGRDPGLRSRATREALRSLSEVGAVTAETAATLDAAYVELRSWEHRVQMLDDAQTHRLPVDDDGRGRVAALCGASGLAVFDAWVEATLTTVDAIGGALFADEEPLASPFGPLVFTGVEDDPQTLVTLARLGFAEAGVVAQTVRAWHHGRIAATRTPRGRELFTRLLPRLLEAAVATGVPDAAFARFVRFFDALTSGVQIQSLFLGRPELFALVVRVLTLSPRLADVLARRPAALDALVGAGFFAPLTTPDLHAAVAGAVAGVRPQPPELEPVMDAVRRAHAETAFRVGVHVLTEVAAPAVAAAAFTALADACLQALAPAALREVERLAGGLDGEVAVIALGKFGGAEMTTTSDLDLMTVFHAAPGATSAKRGWAAETYYARFTQRLVAALSAPTAEGPLYAVDLQLRPSGTAGPVSTSLVGLQAYYAADAQTWEFLALTRARVGWASSPAFADETAAAIETALRHPREPLTVAADVRDMRALMRRERPPSGFWDMKLSPGGLVDVEFAVQFLQLVAAASGGPLRAGTGDALDVLARERDADPEALRALGRAWRLQQSLSQVLRLALDRDADPTGEPPALRALLAAAGEVEAFGDLAGEVAAARAGAIAAAARILG